MDGKSLASDNDTQSTDEMKDALQQIIVRLGRASEGQDADPRDVEFELTTAIADAGLPEQPHPWVEATALEIAGGRVVVMDAKDQLDAPEPERADKA